MDDVRKYLIDFIFQQTGVDLEQYRTDFTKQWERPNEIIVEYREIPRAKWREIQQLKNMPYSKFRMEHVGIWGMMIALKE